MDSFHILHFIDELRVGGAQTHLVTMLREALRACPGVSHRVVGLFGDGPVAEDLREMGVEVEALDLRPHLKRRRFRRAARVLRELIRGHGPDLVEAHLTWSRLLGLYAAWREGVPKRIAFEHGELYFTALRWRIAHWIGQHFATRVVVVSRALQSWAERSYRLSARRGFLLHNCVDTEMFRPPSGPEDSAEFERPESATLFCAVGTLGRGVNKRVDVCIRAVAAAREGGADVGLVVCGEGSQRAELERLAGELAVGEHVSFLGMRDDVPRVLAACDAFCHGAPFEPFGIVCIEAMATGLPVIVPDAGGMMEAVDDGETGLVYHVLDHGGLAAAMARLDADAELRRSMGLAARRAAEERFSVPDYVRRLYSLYGLGSGTDGEAGA